MFNKVIIGGTYDQIHKGHLRLLGAGFQVGKEVIIGLTSDEFASRFRVGKISSYDERKKKLEECLNSFGKNYRIVKIEDSYGVATVDPGIDCIVASEETLMRASEINAIRFKKGLERLYIVVVPLVLADDGIPLSSDRISRGEIDSEGRVLKKRR